MEAKRIVRVYDYRYEGADKQTCICTTEVGNVITLWDELSKSEVVRLKTKETYNGKRTESLQG